MNVKKTSVQTNLTKGRISAAYPSLHPCGITLHVLSPLTATNALVRRGLWADKCTHPEGRHNRPDISACRPQKFRFRRRSRPNLILEMRGKA